MTPTGDGITADAPVEFAARDFVATDDGLFFAVVANGTEEGRVPVFLRYRHDGRQYHKLDTRAAQDLLASKHPEYIFHSKLRDADLHGVPVSGIERHFVPQIRARELRKNPPADEIERIALRVLELLIDHGIRDDCLGVTGSLLIGAHSERSDIDVVISDRDQFHATRAVVSRLLDERAIEPLSEEFWRVAWLRRGGSLGFDDYMWHEQRKFNKLSFENVKVDLSLALREKEPRSESYRKLKRVDLTARILDDTHAFEYPAVWKIESEVATRIVCWTPTYTGQAFVGEKIRTQGWLEESVSGERQVVVGTSREADGELISVVRESQQA